MKPIVAIVGRPNVGKSTLFNRLVGKRVAIIEDEPGTTRDRLYADIVWKDSAFTIVDTGGMLPAPPDGMAHSVMDQVAVFSTSVPNQVWASGKCWPSSSVPTKKRYLENSLTAPVSPPCSESRSSITSK